MSSPNRAQLIEKLILELRLASAHYVMYSQATADKAGLHSTDMECIDHLLMQGPLTAGALSSLTGLTTGTITALIDRLEKAGYVRREPGKRDRRQVLVVPIAEKIDADLIPITRPLGIAVGNLLAEYSERELAFILDYTAKLNQLAADAISRLRA
jgi:DNA-binding MarR family transcriptional regulator